MLTNQEKDTRVGSGSQCENQTVSTGEAVVKTRSRSRFRRCIFVVKCAGRALLGGKAHAGEDRFVARLVGEPSVGAGERDGSDSPRGLEANKDGGCCVWGSCREVIELRDGLEGGRFELAGEREEISVTGVCQSVLEVERAVTFGEPAEVWSALAKSVRVCVMGASVGKSYERFGQGANWYGIV
jgi:hypothetical protein